MGGKAALRRVLHALDPTCLKHSLTAASGQRDELQQCALYAGGTPAIPVRLTGSNSCSSGRVEVFRDGMWGQVGGARQAGATVGRPICMPRVTHAGRYAYGITSHAACAVLWLGVNDAALAPALRTRGFPLLLLTPPPPHPCVLNHRCVHWTP